MKKLILITICINLTLSAGVILSFAGERETEKNEPALHATEKVEKIMKEGKRLLKQKDLDGAIEKFKSALSLAPKRPETYYYLGVIYIRKNQFRKGVEHIRKSIELSPDNLKLRMALAKIFEEKRLWEEAIEEYNIILSRDPDNSRAHYYLGDVSVRTNQFRKGVGHIRRSIELSPDNLKLRMALAKIFEEKRLWKKAMEEYRIIMSRAPDSKEAKEADKKILQIKNKDLVQKKKLKKTIEKYNRTLSANPDDSLTLFKMGRIYLLMNRLKEAGDAFKKVTRIEPENKEAHFYLGGIYEQAGQLSEAIEQLQITVDLDPENQDAIKVMMRIGMIYRKQKRLEDAEKAFKKVLEMDTDNLIARYNLGIIYFDTDRTDTAISEFKTIISMDREGPQGKEAVKRLMKLYAIKGDRFLKKEKLEEGLREYKKIIEIDPESKGVLLAIGRIYARQKKFRDAQKTFEEVVRIDPENKKARLSLGIIYETLMMFDEASVEYKKIMSLDRDSAEGKKAEARARLLQGKRLFNDNQLNKAAGVFRNILKKDPDDYYAHLYLGMIHARKDELRDTAREYRKVIELNPGNLEIRYNLALLYEQMSLEEKALGEYMKILSFKTISKKMAEKVKERASDTRKRKNGFFLNLAYLMAYNDNLNLSDTDPIVDYSTVVSFDISYVNKPKDYLKLNFGTGWNYSIYHISQFDYLSTNLRGSFTLGPFNKNLTLGFKRRYGHLNFEKSSVSDIFSSEFVFRRSIPTMSKISISRSNYKSKINKDSSTKTNSLKFSLSQKLVWGVSTTLSYGFTNYTNKKKIWKNYDYNAHSGGINLSKRLASGLTGNIGYNYTYSDFPHSAPFSNFTKERINKLRTITAGLSYWFNKKIRLFMNYTWMKNRSNLPSRDQLTPEQRVSGAQVSSLGNYRKNSAYLGIGFSF